MANLVAPKVRCDVAGPDDTQQARGDLFEWIVATMMAGNRSFTNLKPSRSSDSRPTASCPAQMPSSVQVKPLRLERPVSGVMAGRAKSGSRRTIINSSNWPMMCRSGASRRSGVEMWGPRRMSERLIEWRGLLHEEGEDLGADGEREREWRRSICSAEACADKILDRQRHIEAEAEHEAAWMAPGI